MPVNQSSLLTRFKPVTAALLLLGVSACATNFHADVSRYQSQLPAPSGQTFAVVADNPLQRGGIEFASYARLVTDRMASLGYTPAASPESAALLVRFDYGVDRGRERIQSTGFRHDPFWSPWYGYGRSGYWGGPGYFGRGGFYGHGAWGYGWNDPFFDNGYESYTVYTSGIDLKIDRRADGAGCLKARPRRPPPPIGCPISFPIWSKRCSLASQAIRVRRCG